MGVGYERLGGQAGVAGDDRRFHERMEANGEHGINAEAARKNGYPAAIPPSRPTNTRHYTTWDGSAPMVSRRSRSFGSISRSLAVSVFQLLRRSRKNDARGAVRVNHAGSKPYMAQLVGVARDVDRDDAVIPVRERHRHDRAVRLAQHEARQPVDG